MELETSQVVPPPPTSSKWPGKCTQRPSYISREATSEHICGAQCNQQYRRIRTFCTLGTLRGTAHVERKKQGDAIKFVGTAISCVNDQSPQERASTTQMQSAQDTNARQQWGVSFSSQGTPRLPWQLRLDHRAARCARKY